MEGKEEEQDKKELNIEEDIRNSRSRGKGRRFLSHFDLQAC